MIPENNTEYKPPIESTPLVSIVMANYNGGDFLKESVESVLNQSYQNIELIVIDDCSTEDDVKYLSQVFDTRIRVYQNSTNKGQTKSLNIGLRLTRGKYIARMDSDDVCMPNRIADQVEFLERNSEIALLGSQAIIINELGEETGRTFYATTPDNIWAYSFFANPFIHSSVMFRHELIDEHNLMYDESYINQDFELWSRIIQQFPTSNLPCQLVKYRIHSNNMTSRHFDENLNNTARIIANRAEHENIEGFNQETVFSIIKYIFDSRDKADADGVDRAQLGHQLWHMARTVAKKKSSVPEFYRLIIFRLFQSSLPPQRFRSICPRLSLLIKMSMLQPTIVLQVVFKLCCQKISKHYSPSTKSRYV